jgi:hypothetical protein
MQIYVNWGEAKCIEAQESPGLDEIFARSGTAVAKDTTSMTALKNGEKD